MKRIYLTWSLMLNWMFLVMFSVQTWIVFERNREIHQLKRAIIQKHIQARPVRQLVGRGPVA